VAVSYDLVRINEEDVRIAEFDESWGCGARRPGWDKAIRLTHLPTGITAFCQKHGSRRRNEIGARTVLSARLLERRRLEQRAFSGAGAAGDQPVRTYLADGTGLPVW
jgi:protein subunit release factor A